MKRKEKEMIEAKKPTLDEMTQYIAERIGESQIESICAAVRYFYMRLIEEEMRSDAANILKGRERK